MKKTDVKKNEFKLRIYDNNTLTNLEELFKTGNFENWNELLGKVVDVGAETMLVRLGKQKALPFSSAQNASPTGIGDVLHLLEKVNVTMNDMFVITSIIETTCAMLLNIQNAIIKGEPISEALIASGAYSDLPDYLQDVKDAIIVSRNKRK